jgi:hypothetical protein
MQTHTNTYIQILQRRSPHPDLPSNAYSYWWEVSKAKYSCGDRGKYEEEHAKNLAAARIARFKDRDAANIRLNQDSTLAGSIYYRFDYKIVKTTEVTTSEDIEVFNAD